MNVNDSILKEVCEMKGGEFWRKLADAIVIVVCLVVDVIKKDDQDEEE